MKMSEHKGESDYSDQTQYQKDLRQGRRIIEDGTGFVVKDNEPKLRHEEEHPMKATTGPQYPAESGSGVNRHFPPSETSGVGSEGNIGHLSPEGLQKMTDEEASASTAEHPLNRLEPVTDSELRAIQERQALNSSIYLKPEKPRDRLAEIIEQKMKEAMQQYADETRKPSTNPKSFSQIMEDARKNRRRGEPI